MLRSLKYTHLFNNLNKSCVYDNPVFLQNVRWRKRRWAPINESKRYWVREKPEIDPDEAKELLERTRIYQTEIKSIRKYFKQKVEEQWLSTQKQSFLDSQKQAFQDILDENEKWNQETAIIREAREEKESILRKEQILQKVLAIEDEKKIQRDSARELVLAEQEAAKDFINIDNIEEEIEKALDERVNFNFALDLEGNKYIGMPEQQLTGSNKIDSSDKLSLKT